MTRPVTDEAIVAYLDGALDPAAQAAFEDRMAQDPALAARVKAHRWLDRQIVAAFGAPPTGEIEPELLERLGLHDRPAERGGPPAWRAPGWRRLPRPAMAGAAATALAACLAFGLWFAGLRAAPDQPLTVQRDGRVVASGGLAQALSGEVSGPVPGQDSGAPGAIRIALTIRTADGPCRTFVGGDGTSGLNGVAGLACHKAGRWEVPVIVRAARRAPADGDYRLASGDVPPAVMAEVDRRIVGDPLTPAEERALMQAGWR